MPRITGENAGGNQSVVLALRILEHLANAHDSVGVTQLAEALGTTKTRIYRHLRTLVQQGYINQSRRTERYQIGTQLITLGRLVAESSDLSVAAQAHMREMRDRTGQSCVLSQIEHGGARVVLALSGRSPIEIGVKPGSLMDFHNTAQGKVLLANALPPFRERVLGGPLVKTLPDTIHERPKLEAELERIRRRGWATAPNQSVLGLNALAAPVFEESGEVLGAVAIVDLVQFLAPMPTGEQLDALLDCAGKISAALGFRPAETASPPR